MDLSPIRRAGTPTNEVDECCRNHDIAYSNLSTSTEQANKELEDCIDNAGGQPIISAIFKAKKFIDKHTGYTSNRLF